MYFPKPYPDELLGSLLIRACHHLGLPPKTIGCLLHTNTDLSFLYPSALDAISRLTNIPAQSLLRKHTVYPYSALSLPIDKRDALERALLTGSARGSSVRFRASLGLHIDALSRLRYCEQCCFAECQRIGESYWHRQHILPGVFVCPLHGDTLRISSISVLPKLSATNVKLPQEVTGDAVNWAIDGDHLRELAAAVMEAMQRPMGTWDCTARHFRDIATLNFRNSSHHEWLVDPFVHQFAKFYGTRFLEQVGLGLTSLGADAWPAQVARGARPTVLLQLRHIMLHLFLKRLGNLSSF